MLARQDLCFTNVICITFLSPELWALQNTYGALVYWNALGKLPADPSRIVGAAVSNCNCFQLGLLYFQKIYRHEMKYLKSLAS